MKAFKIAVWVDLNYAPEAGGGYGFFSQIISGLDNRNFENGIEIYFAGFNLNITLNKPVINIPFTESYLEKKRTNFYHKFFRSHVPRQDIQRNFTNAVKILKENKIDLIFYATPDKIINNFPFIIVHWDLGHKTTYPFPEMAMDGNWDYREETIAKNLSKALLVGVESEQGKKEILENYHVFEEKLKILPLFPSKIISDTIIPGQPNWLNENERFFVYPAQFWPHKNHYNLILAFHLFLQQHPDFRLVLTGADHVNQKYIKEIVNELNINANVVIPGFVSNEELKWMYKKAVGTVFPSFLGPTNMPLLEANYFNCNLACSNLKGHQEMMGDNAIYFDPKDKHSILNSLIELETFDKQNIKTKNQNLTDHFNIENSLKIIENMFLESMTIRRTWGS
ncbi:glycosyltransferase [Pedobacter sp. 22226]|uniref:glycosyltransferase n=1 Tax=Pedobacter sp. 22226 TaxID=3453894 RepID=UPI003F86891F